MKKIFLELGPGGRGSWSLWCGAVEMDLETLLDEVVLFFFF